MRLDVKIAKILEISREKARDVILNQCVSVNGSFILKPSVNVCENDVVSITGDINAILFKPSKLKPEKLPLDIIFEDNFLMVINKQAGVSTHPPSIAGCGTIANAVIDLIDGEGARPGIVHRLDKETTGLLIIAKTEEAKSALSNMIEKREIERRYLALCYFSFRLPEFRIKTQIARDLKDRTKMRVVKTSGKEAITNVFLKETFLNGAFSLAELKLETGRTHQIRLHLAYNNTSIVGDQTYGVKPPSFFDRFAPFEDLFQLLINTKRQMLHAYNLKFIHPFTKKEFELNAELPKDFSDLLSCLQNLKKYVQ